MSDVSGSWTFSCPNPSSDHTHAVSRVAALRQPSRIISTVIAFVCACLLMATGPAIGAEGDGNAFTRPEVLVLVLGGFGPAEQCSISYGSVVALPTAQADLDAIATAGKWQVSDAKGVTKSSGGPNAVQTTSISFSAKGLIGYADGTLPLEPYLHGLKRFKLIEVDYIAPSSFAFRGLEDFENRFVKVQMSQNGNSYRYRIVVKDATFTTLDLPMRESETPEPKESRAPDARRVVAAIGLAVFAALVAYLAMMYISKRKQRGQ